ncbi:hypothetical protein K7432_005478 [Basidiobolus ranarum]|uniref:Uncharacterized protein n=1 Tax=Basidiobolus ranarum TaxID=34480 RepID=A0ABR2WWM2_9FUNG
MKDTVPLELNAGVPRREGLTEVESVTNEDNTADVVAGVAAVSFADVDHTAALSETQRNFKLSEDRVRAVLQDKHTFQSLIWTRNKRLDALVKETTNCLNSSEETSKKEYEYRRKKVDDLTDTITGITFQKNQVLQQN